MYIGNRNRPAGGLHLQFFKIIQFPPILRIFEFLKLKPAKPTVGAVTPFP